MWLISIAAKNLTRRLTRTLLTVFGLSVAVGAVVALRGISQGFESTFVHLYRHQNVDLVVQRAGGTVQLSLGLDEGLEQKIEALPHVHQVIAGLMDVVAFEKYDLFAVIVNGWPPDSPVLARETMLSGRRLQAGDTHKIMLGKVLAGNLGKKVGDQLDVYSEPFEVVGIFESFSVYENGAVFILLSELQRLMDRPHKVTGYVIEADPSGDPAVVAELKGQIEKLDPTLNVVDTINFVHGISQIRVTQAAAWITSAVAMIVGTIGVLNTMVMSVFERAREIGTLRAIGWRKGRIIRLVMCEALLISVVAAALGAMIGIGAVKITGRVPALSGLVEGSVPPQAIFLGCAMALTVGLLGAVYPAYWAANQWPVDALRRR
jgi:putative ABC transport system permease protein